MSTKDLIAELKSNPIFNLSLASKELFHSNMLAWIAEDEDTNKLFVEILKLFGITNEEEAKDIANGLRDNKYMVLREYKNFDLCICEKIPQKKKDSPKDEGEDEYGNIPGQILLILENKFKSIPYKAQLQKYQNDVNILNKEGRKNLLRCKTGKRVGDKNLEEKWKEYNDKFEENSETRLKEQHTHFVLLSLAENIYEFDITKEGKEDNPYSVFFVKDSTAPQESTKWHYVSYKDYSSKLNTHSKNKNDFKGQLIREYSKYVSNFCKYLENELPPYKLQQDAWTQQLWTETLKSNTALREIRMDDIWQKLIANHILIKLCEKGKDKKLVTDSTKYCISTKDEDFVEKNEYREYVKVATDFSRGTALINIIIHIGHYCVFGIQIQDGLYKRFLGTTTEQLRTLNLEEKIKFYCNKLNSLSDMFRYEPKETSDWKFPKNNNGKPIFDEGISPDENHQNKGLKHDTDASLKGFGGYGAPFIAQWKNISKEASVEDVLDAMIDDCLKVREVFPLKEIMKDSQPTNN